MEFDYVLAIAAGLCIGYYARSLLTSYRVAKFRKAMEEYKEAVEKEARAVEESIVRAYITTEGNTFFVYDKKDDSFLAQGTSKEELVKTLESLYPTKTIMVVKSEYDKLENV